jgi:hypothetical protein
MGPTEMTPVEIDTELAALMARQGGELRVKNHIDWSLQLDLRPSEAARMRAALGAVELSLADLDALVAPLAAEFERRGGWERYYTTTNKANAHVHRRTDCKTCREGTRFLWLPQYAGASPSKVRKEVDPCSTCFRRWV